MEKNILILLIVLITSCLWGQEAISETIDSKENKIIKLLQKDKVELIVVGEVIDVNFELIKRNPEKELNINNILAITTVSFKVKKAYKGDTITDIIEVVLVVILL